MVDGGLIHGAASGAMLFAVDARRVGSSLRALRIRQNLRQLDLAVQANVSRGLISEIERGIMTHASIVDLERIAAALGASLDGRVRWRGEQLDRLLDEAHAATVATVVSRLSRAGWRPVVEASFSIWGERGSIDVLAWHELSRTLLVIEVKTVIPDLQAMLHDLDRKVRLAPQVAAERGWRPSATARLVVVAESPTSRGRVRNQRAILDVVLPQRGTAVRAWLRDPRGPMAGLLFLSNAGEARTKGPIWRRERVRVRRSV